MIRFDVLFIGHSHHNRRFLPGVVHQRDEFHGLFRIYRLIELNEKRLFQRDLRLFLIRKHRLHLRPRGHEGKIVIIRQFAAIYRFERRFELHRITGRVEELVRDKRQGGGAGPAIDAAHFRRQRQRPVLHIFSDAGERHHRPVKRNRERLAIVQRIQFALRRGREDFQFVHRRSRRAFRRIRRQSERRQKHQD